jgi:translation initiation factor IF-2
LSTVRIYKVAELLNTSSQEVMALLKRDHGIEVKSASSTIEEVVARQFVERLARQRNVQLPPVAGMFLETPAPVKGKKPGGGARAPEPPAKAVPTLGPPRLVKTIVRPAAPLDESGYDEAEAGSYDEAPADDFYEAPLEAAAAAAEPLDDEPEPAPVEARQDTPPPAPPVETPAPVVAAPVSSTEAPPVAAPPATPVEEPAVAAKATHESAPAPAVDAPPPPVDTTEPVGASAQAAKTAELVAGEARAAETPAPAAPESAPAAAAAAAPATTAHPTPARPAEPRPRPTGTSPIVPTARPVTPPPTGRVVPPTLRLRIEDPNAPRIPAPTDRPQTPRPQAPGQGARPQGGPAGQPGQPRPGGQPGQPRPGQQPGGQLRPAGQGGPPRPGQAPLGARPGGGPAGQQARPPVGGPRPMPSPPIRTPMTPGAPRPSYAPTGAPIRPTYQPSIRPGTPGQPGQPPMGARPGQPGSAPGGYRPGQPPGGGQRPGFGGQRPGGGGHHQQRRSGGRTDSRPSMPPPQPAGPPPVTRTVTLAEGMTVKDLADKLEARVKDVLKKLIDRRMMMTINTTLDTETASMIAREFGADVKMQSFEEEMLQVEAESSRPEDLVARAPVVTVMGHVDHGKTTLLDAIRETRVAEREAGGITQHIGAYAVKVNDRNVVFLDTPGHEAFTMMRARGAKVTDVVILVVAADDGVMPQTKEAIDHAKAAGVPIIVALNKIDKPEANPDLVKKELSDLGLMPEEWGGTTVVVPVSAKKRENLDALLEMVLLVADIGDFKANPKRSAAGTVLEAKLDRGRGPVATVLVQDGTLSVGDTVIAGTIVGKIRALMDDRGRPTKSAGPATPVEVLGLGGLPQPGDTFQAMTDAAKARQIALFRQHQVKEKTLGARGGRLTLESLQAQMADGAIKELPLIIKADVQGSAEVLADSLTKLSDERVKIRVVHAGVGAINESDVLLAATSNAIVIGFNVRPNRDAADVAEREKVDVRHYTVIYNVTDEIKKAMTGLLEPTLKEVKLGTADVRQTFRTPKFGTIAGCMVMSGTIKRSGDTTARLLRDGVMVHEGRLSSLRRFKDDVSEVKTGFECGIAFDGFNDIKVGDTIEVFTVERVAATV